MKKLLAFLLLLTPSILFSQVGKFTISLNQYDSCVSFTDPSYNDFIDSNDVVHDTNTVSPVVSIDRYSVMLSKEQRRSLNDESILIVRTKNLRRETYTLTFTPENLGNLMCYLYDSHLNTTLSFSMARPFTYTYVVDSVSNSASGGRIRLRFKACSALSIDETVNPFIRTEKEKLINVKSFPGVISVELQKFELGEYLVRVINYSGKILYTSKFTHKTDGTRTINVPKFTDKVYIVQIFTPYGNNYTKSFVQ
jgi:hypothetical protein